jgi:hypothetical protein
VLGSEPFFGAIANTSVSVYEIGLSMVLGLICGLTPSSLQNVLMGADFKL